MNNARAHALLNSSQFKALAKKRRVVAVSLTAINIIAYLGYVLGMGFARDLMASPVAGGPINIGLLSTIGLVIMAPVISCYYIWWTNRYYDPALSQLLDRASSGQALQ